MKCIIVDDEPLAHEILSDYISKIDNLKLVASYTNPIEAFASIDKDQIELIFLDVQMPELTGIQFLKLLGNKCKVILTTAYTDYAYDGYEHNVIDYLLKPISYDRFARAIQKVFSDDTEHRDLQQSDDNKEQVFIKTEHKIIRVNLSDILYIEGLKDYISIYTKEERILTLMNLKKIEEMLPSKRFMRVHKSYIISFEKISSIEKNRIYINSNGIPIGDTYKEEFYIRLEAK